MFRKWRKINQKIVVVLEGIKACIENTGVAPLSLAMHDVVGPEDQVLVLTLLYWNIINPVPPDVAATAGPSTEYNDDNNEFSIQICDALINPNIKFLYQEISQRKEIYTKVFKPFYLTCETYGVKFEVKIAAGFRPKDIVIEEANSVKVNWLVMDRCFAKDPSFQLSGTKCNIISVNDEGEAIFHHRSSSSSSSSEPAASSSSAVNRPKPLPKPFHLKLMKGTKPNFGKAALNACGTALPDVSDSSSQSSDHLITSFNGKLKMVAEPPRDQGMISSTTASSSSTHPQLVYYPFGISSRNVCDPNFVLGLPLKLTKQVIEEITLGFSKKISSDEDQQFVVYDGFFAVSRSRVLVKMFRGESGGVFLAAEKKAAFSMRHRSILRLIGYHQSDNTTFLVFPFAERGTLDSNLNGLRGEEFNLTFQDKLRIAIGIAQGLRYMHEECPRGPVVHGKLLLSNVFIGDDLKPQISGFGRATWLHLKQSWPIFIERCCLLEDHLNHDLMAQVKLDVLSFGVLLLRLFCRRSVPQDDDTLIKWARPLLLERAFHILLHEDEEEDEEDLDMHEMFRVMCTAFQCAVTRPDNRPYMSEVISYLKGESFCVMQTSP